MTMRHYAALYATVERWKDEKDEFKKRRIPVGVLMLDDATGTMSIWLDALPITPRGPAGWQFT